MSEEFEYREPRGDDELDRLALHAARSFALPHATAPATLRGVAREAELRVIALDGEVVGGCGLHHMGQYFGGRRVGCGGIGLVSIAPDVRGRGVARSLMTQALHEFRDKGEPLSTLYPAAQGLYRQLGWEQAGSWSRYALPIANLTQRERSMRVREIDLQSDADCELLREVYAARARVSPGHLDRSEAIWNRVLRPTDADASAYLIEGDHGPEGYVVYTLARGEGFRYDFVARDLVAQTDRALRRLLSLVADHRSLGTDLVWIGGPCDPILLAVDDQVHRVRDHWRWMLRLVDVRAALVARGYAPGVRGEVHLDIVDDLLPDNRGPLVLEVQDGRAEVREGGRAEVRLPVGALAALYSGDASPHVLTRAGRMQSDGPAATTLATFFAGPAPWLPDFF